MSHSKVLPLIFILLTSTIIISLSTVSAATVTDTTGGTVGAITHGPQFVYAFLITITASGTVQSIGVNWADVQAGNVAVALYSAGSGKPANLLTQSSSTAMSTTTGWQDVPVSSSYSVTPGSYWVALALSAGRSVFFSGGSRAYYVKSFGAFDSTWAGTGADQLYQVNMRVTYQTGPPPSDFTITASPPTSQTVGAGATATYSLSIQFSPTLTTTVNLAVTSGCPSGVTCTFSPNSVTGSGSVTLSVPTLITTPSGTTTITVTASSTSPILSHTATVQLTVNGPGSYPVYVYAGSSHVIVTVSWSSSGQAAIYLTGPGGSPTLTESGAIVYDRTVYVTGTTSPSYIHRVTFTLSPAPTTTQTWTALVSLSGSYTVTIEVNSPSPTT